MVLKLNDYVIIKSKHLIKWSDTTCYSF